MLYDPIDRSHVRVALFVDFDNIYLGLQDIDPRAAKRFATDPARWLSWVEAGMPTEDGEGRSSHRPRALLMRRCYLNPQRFHRYRAYFTRSAFSVVDCPSLTRQGNNSADIHMVLDIMDALEHETRFDEFIILSGDSDFRPVLLRLRGHDRRTTVLTIGPAAEAYKSACEWLITEETFIEAALGLYANGASTPSAPTANGRTNGHADGNQTNGASGRGAAPDTAQLGERIVAVVEEVVAAADEPVPMASAAGTVINRVGRVATESSWAGARTFKALLEQATDRGFEIVTHAGTPGYLYDPERHRRPGPPSPPDVRFDDPDVSDLARRVHQITSAPRLTPEEYAGVFEALAAELADEPFDLSRTSKHARDRTVEAGQPVLRAAVWFILRGIAYAGYELTGEPRAHEPRALGEAYREHVLELCADADLSLSTHEEELLSRWTLGGLRVVA